VVIAEGRLAAVNRARWKPRITATIGSHYPQKRPRRTSRAGWACRALATGFFLRMARGNKRHEPAVFLPDSPLRDIHAGFPAFLVDARFWPGVAFLESGEVGLRMQRTRRHERQSQSRRTESGQRPDPPSPWNRRAGRATVAVGVRRSSPAVTTSSESPRSGRPHPPPRWC
jgi:hypothetical protein